MEKMKGSVNQSLSGVRNEWIHNMRLILNETDASAIYSYLKVTLWSWAIFRELTKYLVFHTCDTRCEAVWGKVALSLFVSNTSSQLHVSSYKYCGGLV